MFQNYKFYTELEKITHAIKNHDGESRIVGGSVRDAIIGKEVQDFDIATTLLPNETLSVLQKEKIKAIPTGIKYGTVSAVINKRTYEITTLRRDVETYGRKAKVEYTDSWHEDAARRDFTINAMSYDLISNKLYDYYNGKEHLHEGIVKFVGSPSKRVQEDYLRIIRFYRFQGKYGKQLDEESVAACRKFAPEIANLSGERRYSELQKIAHSSTWHKSVMLMLKDDILTQLLGIKIDENAELLLDNIFHFDNKIDIGFLIYILSAGNYRGALESLRLSNKQQKYLMQMHNLCAEVSDYKKEAKKIIFLFGNKLFVDLVKYHAAERNDFSLYIDLYTRFSNWTPPHFPLNGEDIKKHFGVFGVEIGELLQKAQNIWFEHDMNIGKKDLLKALKSE